MQGATAVEALIIAGATTERITVAVLAIVDDTIAAPVVAVSGVERSASGIAGQDTSIETLSLAGLTIQKRMIARLNSSRDSTITALTAAAGVEGATGAVQRTSIEAERSASLTFQIIVIALLGLEGNTITADIRDALADVEMASCSAGEGAGTVTEGLTGFSIKISTIALLKGSVDDSITANCGSKRSKNKENEQKNLV